MLARRLSVRATEQLVSSIIKVKTVRIGDGGARQRTMEYATKLLEDSLRTSVRIKPRRKGGGRIVIDYADATELERLIGQLRDDKR